MGYKRTSPMPISEGGTNATTMATTDGVAYFDGTRLVTTAVGTSTFVLTSNGAGVAPTFQATGAGVSGALQLIQTQTATTQASLVFTSGITSPLNTFFIVGYNISDATASNTSVIAQISVNGGSTYIATGYKTTNVAVTNGLLLANIAASTSKNTFNCYVYNLTSNVGIITSSSAYNEFNSVGPSVAGLTESSSYTTATTLANALRITMSDGSNFSGVFSLYSVAS